MERPHYLRPTGVEEALAALADGRLAVLAGGTDFFPTRVGRPIGHDVLDISRLTALRGISSEGSYWRIGALTTWTDVSEQPLPALFDGLKLAAREIGGRQVQNAGTLAGNVCNASPAADGIPCLLALDAAVELASTRGRRRVPLSEFVAGPRRTLRGPDELVTALLVPERGAATRSTFVKLGARRYLVISIVSVAVTLEADSQASVIRAAVAVGACSPVPQRISALEARLVGRRPGELSEQVRAADLAVLAPMSDVRGSAEYRLDAAAQLIRRALAELANE